MIYDAHNQASYKLYPVFTQRKHKEITNPKVLHGQYILQQ